MFKAPRSPRGISRDRAETVALRGLSFLAADATRLSRFLTLTGTDPQELNNWDGNPAIQAAVLDHFLADESLLLVFTGEAGVSPQEIAPAQAVLAGAAAG